MVVVAVAVVVVVAVGVEVEVGVVVGVAVGVVVGVAVGVAVVVGVVVGVKLEGYGIKEKDRRETRVMAAKKPIRRWFIQFTNGLISTGCWTNRREVARICRDSSVICGKPQLYELKPVKPKRKAK